MTSLAQCKHLHVTSEPLQFGQGRSRPRWICAECKIEFAPAPESNQRYCLFYVPHTGLFFDGGDFLDGHQERIKWDRKIPIFTSHSRAVLAKESNLQNKPDAYANGRIVVLTVELQDRG